METKDFLRILKQDIHTTVMATVDEAGHPVARVIDVMLVDDRTLYFITAKGKEFYRQLMEQKYVAVSGACGGEGLDKKEASLHMKAVSVRGSVRNLGNEKLAEVFAQNPYMNEIYPDEASRMALEVFCIESGTGEFFDLSTKPITRESFTLGAVEASAEETKNEQQQQNEQQKGQTGGQRKGQPNGYYITADCTGCQTCVGVCPQQCIDTTAIPLRILSENCLHCGNCMTVCPAGAVKRAGAEV